MSTSPRTDIMVTGNSDPSSDEYGDLADFARQLERESDALRLALAAAESRVARIAQDRDIWMECAEVRCRLLLQAQDEAENAKALVFQAREACRLATHALPTRMGNGEWHREWEGRSGAIASDAVRGFLAAIGTTRRGAKTTSCAPLRTMTPAHD